MLETRHKCEHVTVTRLLIFRYYSIEQKLNAEF